MKFSTRFFLSGNIHYFYLMNHGRENSLHHLTDQCHVSDLGIGVWQELAETYPYFIPAQFFLAAKLKKDSVPAAAAQIVKTGLYFTNPYWLQIQLQELVEEAPVLHTEKRIATPVPAAESSLADAGLITIQPIEVDEIIIAEDSPIHAEVIVQTVLDAADAEKIEETETTEDFPLDAAAIVQTALDAADAEEIEETETTEDLSATIDAPLHTTQKSISENKISGILSGQLAQFKKPISADEKLEIEKESETRLHTIDYFASQGIKIDLSAIPKDKLTSSMLRFTDWLKQMKTPNATPANLGTTDEMEKAVIEIAKVSNINREVFTEAMADVLAKQGQLEKAIQLLNKLSFINPEKSSYFATRIEQLKGIA